MGRELGRISGPLLAENLLRNGNNLAFETNLLYLDVVNGWIGIKNATPTRTLNITGKTNTTNLIVDTGATVANLEFTTSQIQNVSGSVTLSPNQSLNPTVNVPRLTTAFFDVTTNSINNTVLDSNIVLDPMGTGRLVVTTANVDIRGSLHATGNITWDGSVVLGDSDTDNVTFNADINSNIIPNVTNASNLGSVAKEWRNLYSRNLSSNNFVSSTLTVNGNTTVTGDASIDGSVTLGNEATDTVTIYDHLTQSINPKLPNTYTLGKITGTPKIWNTLYAGLLNVDAVTQISNNTITTLTTDTDLQLTAAGTGTVSVVTTDVDIANNLTVLGSSNTQAVGIVGTLDLPGSFTYIQTGNASRTGATNITGNVTVNGANVVQFQDIKFDSNKITTTLANNDLTFTANGTGIVKVINSDVQVDNNLTVSLTSNANSVTATSASANAYDIGSVYITGNTITTDVLNTNLVLSANGTGIINVTTTDVTLTNNLTVNGSSTLAGVGIVGTLDLPGLYTYAQTGATSRIGDTNITGNVTVNGANVVQFQDIKFDSNKITTTLGNNDLTFTANGTGTVKVINSDVQVDNNLTVNLILNANSLQTAGSITAVDFNIGSLYIKDNISVVPTNTNLILSAYAGKNVHVLTSDVTVPQTLTVAGPFTIDGTSTLKAVTIVGNTLQTGDIIQTGSTGVTGTFGATGNIIVTGPSSFLSVNNVKFDSNVISATTTDANLEFRANGAGGVVLERYLKFANNAISNIFDSNNIDLAFGNVVLAEDGQNLILESGDFYLADTLLDGDFSIKFTPNGIGNLVINSNKAFAVAYGNNTNRLLTDLGEIRQNSTTKIYEGKSGTGNVLFNNIYDTDGNTYITPELTPGTNDNVLRFGINGLVKATVSSTKLFTETLHADNVRISGTTIDNLINSNDLILAPNGTGTVKVNNVGVAGNKFTNNTNTALVFENSGTGYVQFTGTYGILIPRGPNNQRAVTPEIGETRYNTTSNYLEVFDGIYWVAASGSSNVATLDEIQAELNLFSLILG